MAAVLTFLKGLFSKDKMNPFKILLHPIETVEDMKEKRNGSVFYATLSLLAFTISEIIVSVGKGYIFNTARIEEFNIMTVFSRSLFLVLLFVIGNWSLCTLLDGEGRMVDIYIYTCYCLLPLTFFRIFDALFSNFLTSDEYVFVSMIGVAIYIWFFCLLIFAMKRLHNYTMGKIIFNMLLSFFAMAVIYFLIFLFLTLMQQVYIFLATLFTEISIRFEG